MADALELVLELSRAKRVEDPYAMSMRPQEYNLRSAGGSTSAPSSTGTNR